MQFQECGKKSLIKIEETKVSFTWGHVACAHNQNTYVSHITSNPETSPPSQAGNSLYFNLIKISKKNLG